MSNDGYTASESGAVAAADPMIGQIIDKRYKITRKLGEGGMGEVYAADHLRINRRLAIKLLRAEVLTNEEAVARFEQEAMTASSIGHENIIRIEDSGKLDDGRIYLAMELLDGLPFNDLIDEQQISPDRLLNILIQTCHGLRAAHDKNIIHRDMKPENIYITPDGKGGDLPKLLDFGIAKVSQAEGENHLTRTGTIFGTPFYMAPEQALGQSVDLRVDVYAMGVIMYEVFTGEVPFGGESFMGILTQHITTEPTPPSITAQKNGRVLVPGIEAVILKAMKKEPADRYQNMSELVEALIPLYRAVAGSGMSTYMEAHQPISGAMPPLSGGIAPVSGGVAPISGGVAPVSGGYAPHGAPIPMPVIHEDPSQPYGVPGGAPMGMPMGTPGAISSHGSQPPYQALPGDSLMVPATKSRKGIFIALALVLLAAGGTAAFFLTKDAGGEDKEPVVATKDVIDAGAAVTAVSSDATAVAKTTPDAAATVAANTTADAGTIKIVPVVKVEMKPVILDSKPPHAKIYRNGKFLGKAPQLIMVDPNEPVLVVLEAKKYKDIQVTIDGSTKKFTAKLERKGSGRTNPVKPDPKPDPIKPDPVKPKVKFCDRPENRNKDVCMLE